ncbi:CLUMA_CG001124, isoform A [Clunio marinus]|uniref:CLUMA_CG001124, isoform A n=1 Tax=Clunio marinus TaxID=568069 RepID=A0A1J1HIE2_9DIPT|nr:CLUMA_CG001124, isoform A [Clunio marinus]
MKLNGFMYSTIEYTQDKRLKFKKSRWEFVWFIVNLMPTFVVWSSFDMKMFSTEHAPVSIQQRREIIGILCGFMLYTTLFSNTYTKMFQYFKSETFFNLLSTFKIIEMEGVDEFLAVVIRKSSFSLMKESELIEDILIAKQIINMICENLDNIGSIYGISIWSAYSYSCFYLIIISFGIIHYFISPIAKNFTRFLTTASLWLITFSLLLLCFAISNSIKRETRGIEEKVFRIQYKVKRSPKVIKFAQLLSLQLHHRPPQISYGVFIMDWTFLLTTVDMIFGYLIIILQ